MLFVALSWLCNILDVKHFKNDWLSTKLKCHDNKPIVTDCSVIKSCFLLLTSDNYFAQDDLILSGVRACLEQFDTTDDLVETRPPVLLQVNQKLPCIFHHWIFEPYVILLWDRTIHNSQWHSWGLEKNERSDMRNLFRGETTEDKQQCDRYKTYRHLYSPVNPEISPSCTNT